MRNHAFESILKLKQWQYLAKLWQEQKTSMNLKWVSAMHILVTDMRLLGLTYEFYTSMYMVMSYSGIYTTVTTSPVREGVQFPDLPVCSWHFPVMQAFLVDSAEWPREIWCPVIKFCMRRVSSKIPQFCKKNGPGTSLINTVRITK